MISAWLVKKTPTDISVGIEMAPSLMISTKGSAVRWWQFDLKRMDQKFSSEGIVGCVVSRRGDPIRHIIFQCTDGYVRLAPIPIDVYNILVNHLDIITDNEFDSMGEVYRMLSL